MKNILKLVAFTMVLFSTSAMAIKDPVTVKLPSSRTSMDYAVPIRNLVNAIENYKWETKIGLGYHFVQMEAPFEGEATKDKIYVLTKTFFYGKLIGETEMYLVQSKYDGYIDIVDWRTSERLSVKYSKADNHIELFRAGKADDIYRNVNEWSVNPNPPAPISTAEEDGWVF